MTYASGPGIGSTYSVVEGDTVSIISAKIYNGNPSLWRPLLDYNNIVDPRLLTKGMVLTIPSG